MSKRIVRVAKEVNKDIKSLVKILGDHGITISSNPASLVTDEMEKILYKALNLDYIPAQIAPQDSVPTTDQPIGSKSIEEVSMELNITRKTIVRILSKAGNNISKFYDIILSPEQIDILIRNRLEYQSRILDKKTKDSKYVEKGFQEKVSVKNQPLTKRASRKRRKKEEIARLERRRKAVFKFSGLFKSLVSRNPKGHRGFLGEIWPVKK